MGTGSLLRTYAPSDRIFLAGIERRMRVGGHATEAATGLLG